MKILEIDDNRDLADCIAQLIEVEQHQIVTCYDGSTALEHLAQQSFDLILLDAKLPDTSGFELMTHIYNRSASQRVILITGYRIDQLLQQAAPGESHTTLQERADTRALENLLYHYGEASTILVPIDPDINKQMAASCLQTRNATAPLVLSDDSLPEAIEPQRICILYSAKPLIQSIYYLYRFRKRYSNPVVILFPAQAQSVSYKDFDLTGCIFKPFDPEQLLNLIK